MSYGNKPLCSIETKLKLIFRAFERLKSMRFNRNELAIIEIGKINLILFFLFFLVLHDLLKSNRYFFYVLFTCDSILVNNSLRISTGFIDN